MAAPLVPFTTVRSPSGIVATADQLATGVGLVVLARGGNAVDAAIAANAAIAVTGPHLCGMGGDLWALVHVPGTDEPVALCAAGRAGSRSSADELRAEGHRQMPFRLDARTVTMPGCVDGWLALHERFGSMPLADLLAPAVTLAAGGFPASSLLAGATGALPRPTPPGFDDLVAARAAGDRVVRPGVAEALRALGRSGRDGFYGGAFGAGLLALDRSPFTADDLAMSQADWVTPVSAPAWGAQVWTTPPPSQGYLTAMSSAIASGLDLPDDPDDPRWVHVLVESAIAAGHDRPAVLFDGADGAALLDEAQISARRATIDPDRAGIREVPGAAGDTTYLCTADASGMAVSLIQSNASGFGSWVVEPTTRINLHNRGLGFSLEAGHPAELAPGRRPPHTLCPALATDGSGDLVAVFGTQGGDGQPQINLQVLARLIGPGGRRHDPARAIAGPRFVLTGSGQGFDTWTADGGPRVLVEGHAPDAWRDGLAARGHRVVDGPAWDHGFGHACAIVPIASGWAAAADPRARVSSAAGL